jgi:hypothetical protein
LPLILKINFTQSTAQFCLQRDAELIHECNTFWRDMLLPFTEQKNPEDGHSRFPHDLHTYLPNYTASQIMKPVTTSLPEFPVANIVALNVPMPQLCQWWGPRHKELRRGDRPD